MWAKFMDDWRECKESKPMTNADRIRAMTDEELAKFIDKHCLDNFCEIICGGTCKALPSLHKTAAQACQEMVMNWLKLPVGGNEND